MKNISTYENDIIKHLKRNRNKRDVIIANIPHVAASGMSRHIKLATIYKGEFVNITWLAAKLLNKKLNKNDALTISGCGMDMIFHTIDCLYSALGFEHGYKLNAVQNYKRF